MQRWNYILLNTRDPAVLLYVLGMSNARYMYLSQADRIELSQGEIINAFTKDLPVVFKNNEATIYELPELTPPSPTAGAAVLNFFNNTQAYNITSNIMLSLSLPSRLGLNYQIINLPLKSRQEQHNLTMTDDMETVIERKISEGFGTISLDDDRIQGNFALTISNITTTDNGYFAVKKTGNWDLTGFDHMAVWVKPPTGEIKWIKVIFRESTNYMTWIFKEVPANRWEGLSIPLKNPYSISDAPLDLSKVESIEVGFTATHKTSFQEFKVDCMTTYNLESCIYLDGNIVGLLDDARIIMLPQDLNFSSNGLIQWVDENRTLLVLSDTNRLGSFAKWFGIFNEHDFLVTDKIVFKSNGTAVSFPRSKISTVSITDPNTRVYASYYGIDNKTSPFLLEKDIGKGRVIYARVPQVILGNQTNILINLFNEVMENRNLNIRESKYEFNYFPSYRTLEKNSLLNGSVTIKTSHILASFERIRDLMVCKEKIATIPTNSTIHIESIGNFLVKINGSIRISSDQSSSYLTISNSTSQSCSISIEGNSLDIIAPELNNSYSMVNGKIELKTSTFRILARDSLFEVTGESLFESARIATSLTPPS